MSISPADLHQLYQQYISHALSLESKRQPGQGLLGMGSKPADDPCHETFVKAAEEAAAALALTRPQGETLLSLLRLIFRVPEEHRDTLSLYWTLVAAQRCALPLIPLLSPGNARVLLKEFGRLFRPWQRMPVQKEVMQLLSRQQKMKP